MSEKLNQTLESAPTATYHLSIQVNKMNCSFRWIYIFSFLVIISVFASPLKAQQGNLEVSTITTDTYSIRFAGVPGVTKEQAGAKVMEAGCSLARQQGFTHLGVSYFRMMEDVQAVRTQRGQTGGRMDSDGRVTDLHTTQDRYRAARSGRATLNVVLMSQGGVDLTQSTTDIIEAAGCTIQSHSPN